MTNLKNYKSILLLLIVLYSAFFLIQCAVSSQKSASTNENTENSVEQIRKKQINAFRAKLKPNGTINADLELGKETFLVNCAPCHGSDGKRLQLGTQQNPRTLGNTAYNSPETFFLMASFGESEREMVAYYEELSKEELIAVTAYAQSLPQN